MLLNRALKKAKRTDEEKVGLNIKVPIGLKNDFDEMCKQNGVSMTSMMLALIETVVDESKGIYETLDAETLLQLNNEINRLEEEINQLCTIEETSKGTQRIPNAYMDKDPIAIAEFDQKVDELKRLKTIFKAYKGESYDSDD